MSCSTTSSKGASSPEGAACLDRHPGHAAIFDSALVHGVSSLLKGVRYSLFAFYESDAVGPPGHCFPFTTVTLQVGKRDP